MFLQAFKYHQQFNALPMLCSYCGILCNNPLHLFIGLDSLNTHRPWHCHTVLLSLSLLSKFYLLNKEMVWHSKLLQLCGTCSDQHLWPLVSCLAWVYTGSVGNRVDSSWLIEWQWVKLKVSSVPSCAIFSSALSMGGLWLKSALFNWCWIVEALTQSPWQGNVCFCA